MSIWVWIFGSCGFFLAVFVLSALFFRIHYCFSWKGEKEWELEWRYAFWGWSHSNFFSSKVKSVERSERPRKEQGAQGSSALGQKGFLRIPRLFRFNKERLRRFLFRFLTDGELLKALAWTLVKYGGRVWALLNPRIDCSIGGPDPMRLGRLSAVWQAFQWFPALRQCFLELRFQDRKNTLSLTMTGTVSLARAIIFFLALVLIFPWLTLFQRLWISGWKAELTGWRHFAYGQLRRLAL